MQIFEYPNFVSKEECEQIKTWFESNRPQAENGEQFFNGRTIPYATIDEPGIKTLINRFRFDATMQAVVAFNKKLYPEYTDLVHWPIGKGMEIHSDAFYLDGSPGKYPWRHCGGVLYLNDDYLGGETTFPNFNLIVKPEAGKLVIFSSDLEHRHGVLPVHDSDRYTMPIWFTERADKIEV